MDKIAITEKDFQGQIKDLAKLFGWLYYHTWRSIHSPAGFPDCVMIRGGRLIFAELKSEKGKLSEKQEEWITAMRLGQKFATMPNWEVYVWRPSQIEEIIEILR